MPLRANSYMDFCCDGNVTLECNCDLLRVPRLNQDARSAYSYMDFCCDGNVTQDVTATMDGGDDFQSILTKDISSIFKKLFSIFSIKLFSKYFHWILKMGLLSTYRFSVVRHINV